MYTLEGCRDWRIDLAKGIRTLPLGDYIDHWTEVYFSCTNKSLVIEGANTGRCEDGEIVYDGEKPSCGDEKSGNAH